MTAENNEVLVKTEKVTKTYRTGEIETHALQDITTEVTAGEFLAIVGPSGSGKTTLLNLIGALDAVTSGNLEVMGRDVVAMTGRQRAELRLRSLGFVFQAYNLFPVLSAQENVEFVLELQGIGKERCSTARAALEELGLLDFADRRPTQLSGGQQQRVAVARAIAAKPKLVLADEPTANLDGENARILLDMMRELNEKEGITFVFSTHDPRVVAYARRVITLVDGKIAKDVIKESEDNAEAPAEYE